MKNKIFINYLFILFLLIIQSQHVSSNDKILKDQFFNEAPKKWKEYLGFCGAVEGTIIFNRYDDRGEKIANDSTTICNSFPMNSVQRILPPSNEKAEPNTHLINCFGKNYWFEIKKNDFENDNWYVTGFDSFSSSLKADDWKYVMPFQDDQKIKERGLDRIRSHLAVGVQLTRLELLPVLISLPEFEIKSIVEKQIDGTNIVELIYKFEPNDDTYNFVVRSGKLLLFSDSWLLKEAEFERSYGDGLVTQNHFFYEYEENSSDSFPIIKKLTRKSYYKNKHHEHEEFIYSLHKTVDISPNRFTLSHYGLPEPDFGERRTNRIRYIIMAVGLLLIGIGAWRLIQKQRENA